MKSNISKKAQLYGLSIFIYSIAIAIVLIIGLVGLSREISVYSHAGLQRQYSLHMSKNTEMIRTLLDQERAYTIDKALFFTGAYGGYSRGIFIEPDEFDCGIAIVDIDYFPEKELPYWKNYGTTCIPDNSAQLSEVFKEYAGGFLTTPSKQVIDAIRMVSSTNYFSYRLDVPDTFEDSLMQGIVETTWLSIPPAKIRMEEPAGNPLVTYEASVMSQISHETRFYELFEASKNVVENQEFEKTLENLRDSPISMIIDNSQIVVRQEKDGTIYSCSCSDSGGEYGEGRYDSTGDGSLDADLRYWQTCEEAAAYCITPAPFKAIVEHYECGSDVSDVYSGRCRVIAERNMNTGNLEIIRFEKTCSQSSNNDDDAIRCILNKIIEDMNSYFDDIFIIEDEIASRYEVLRFELTYSGNSFESETKLYVSDNEAIAVIGCDEFVCGVQGEPCCPEGADYLCEEFLICDENNICSCGEEGQPCCHETDCESDLTCDANKICVSCGEEGQPCCNGQCSEGLVCHDGTCMDCGMRAKECCPPDNSCYFVDLTDPWCIHGYCQEGECGMYGQPCCEPHDTCDNDDQHLICCEGTCLPVCG